MVSQPIQTMIWCALLCRMYLQIAEKLGGEDEAADAMGKLIRNVASRFADEKAIGEVPVQTSNLQAKH